MGVTEQTYYRWKKSYGWLGVHEIRRLKLLEEENRRLKQLVADLSLDKLMLQDVLQKIVRPERRRELVPYLEWTYRISERRGGAALLFDSSPHRYRAIRKDQAVFRGRIRELAAARVALRLFPHLHPGAP
jgi:putative transposase